MRIVYEVTDQRQFSDHVRANREAHANLNKAMDKSVSRLSWAIRVLCDHLGLDYFEVMDKGLELREAHREQKKLVREDTELGGE